MVERNHKAGQNPPRFVAPTEEEEEEENFDINLCSGSCSRAQITEYQSGLDHRNVNMAHVLARKVCGLPKSLDISKYIETVPVISYRYSTGNTSQHSWEPVEKETHTGQVCCVHICYNPYVMCEVFQE
jgi:hypothetical protein